jgi:transcription antitermination factor NusG
MKKWYAVYTKPNHEKKVSALLSKKKIENYCPLNKIVFNLKEEKKKPDFEPLFPNYVFVHISEHDMVLVKQQSGVINFVYWLGRPVNIKGMDMENIQEFVDAYTNISLEKTEVSMNNLVRIVSRKPVNDEFDNVIALHSTQVKITLPTLGYILCADAGEEAYETISYQSKLVKV